MTKQSAAKKNSSDAKALTQKDLMKCYEEMLLIRRFEEKAGQLYGMGLIAGFCHLYIGQEAVVVGMQSVMEKGDSSVTSYRDHGHIVASGIDPKDVMAELTGRATGCSKGKGGSMHMFNTAGNFYGGHGIVGAQVPIGTGLAFANKYRKNGKIAVTYLGDGAINQGQVYESFNMAKLWSLPVIYVVENNEYAMGTAVKRSSSEVQLYKRGLSFGIPGEQVDGMDVIKVHEAAVKAADFVRSGNGPIILEMKTYRYRGHSMSDPAKYRSKEEVEEYKQKHDPIERLKKEIETRYKVKEDDFKVLDTKIKAIVKEVEDFAKNSPEPSEDELYTDIYNEK
jgi:pyruvate dehydrogenase E1 component alpha subunit